MKATRDAIKALSLPLFAPDEAASPAITAVAPVSVESEQIRAVMKKRFDISLAGGQDHFKGKIFRIGHLGFVSDRDILAAIGALEATLRELGYESMTPGLVLLLRLECWLNLKGWKFKVESSYQFQSSTSDLQPD
jgi:aspartate aminotransferase-like enzyme